METQSVEIVVALFSPRSKRRSVVEQAIDRVSGRSLRVFSSLDECFFAQLDSTDLGMVIVDGASDDAVEAILSFLGRARSSVPIVIIGDAYDPTKICHWLQARATECLTEPVNPARISFLIESLTIGRLRARLRRESEWITDQRGEPICCGSPDMRRLLVEIRRVADEDLSLLLTGETGTGKTRLAQYVHEISERRNEPLVVVNCGSIPETLFESELFGHRKGAFTGADQDRVGKLSEAGAGTILLDEIDTLSLACQTKLLRAVDACTFEPLGSNSSLKVRSRLIFATNQPLQPLMKQGAFRGDLYYRISGIELVVPPLRERQHEIELLAEAFAKKYADRHRQPVKQLSAPVRQVLREYSWPGNIRELKHVIDRASAISDGPMLLVEHLPARLSAAARRDRAAPGTVTDSTAKDVKMSPKSETWSDSRRTAEIASLKGALRRCANNRAQAARELGISRSALYKKLARHGLMNYPATE